MLADHGCVRNQRVFGRGLIVFEGVEHDDMAPAISKVCGAQRSPRARSRCVDQKKAPGVIDMKYDPAAGRRRNEASRWRSGCRALDHFTQ